jgi:hypothetical protein
VTYHHKDVIVGSRIGDGEIKSRFIGVIPLEIGKGHVLFINIKGITTRTKKTTQNNKKKE